MKILDALTLLWFYLLISVNIFDVIEKLSDAAIIFCLVNLSIIVAWKLHRRESNGNDIEIQEIGGIEIPVDNRAEHLDRA